MKRRRSIKNKKGINNFLETKGDNEDGKNKSIQNNFSKVKLSINDELKEMDFEEAILYDKRSYIKIYWSTLIDSQIILGTFCTDNNLDLLIIKTSFLIYFFEISFFLNALFYTDDYISDAYYNNGVLDFVSGLPKSIYSVIATLILGNLLKILSNNKSEFMQLIKENSKNEDYIKLMDNILVKLRNKLIVYFILVLILGFFFLYYVSSFCAVYRYSQKYWILGCLESFAIDSAISVVICLLIALFRYIAIRKKIKCFLILSNIISTFF